VVAVTITGAMVAAAAGPGAPDPATALNACGTEGEPTAGEAPPVASARGSD
jgi:hypothetical protein